jgi:sec1 family domain-containing protein 1
MATLYSQPQTQAPLSLRELQKKALLRVLNLNAEEEHDAGVQASDVLGVTKGDPVWKFLVFDKMGQDIISSVLRVSDLREAGVTVHMQLKADRLQMEDVPASANPNAVTADRM